MKQTKAIDKHKQNTSINDSAGANKQNNRQVSKKTITNQVEKSRDIPVPKSISNTINNTRNDLLQLINANKGKSTKNISLGNNTNNNTNDISVNSINVTANTRNNTSTDPATKTPNNMKTQTKLGQNTNKTTNTNWKLTTKIDTKVNTTKNIKTQTKINLNPSDNSSNSNKINDNTTGNSVNKNNNQHISNSNNNNTNNNSSKDGINTVDNSPRSLKSIKLINALDNKQEGKNHQNHALDVNIKEQKTKQNQKIDNKQKQRPPAVQFQDNLNKHPENSPKHNSKPQQHKPIQQTSKPKVFQQSPKPINKLQHHKNLIQRHTQLINNSFTHQQLQNVIPISAKQNKRLKKYFKHICNNVCDVPKNITFERVENIYRTINLTQWMIFCKKFKILDRFKQSADGYGGFDNGVQFLSYYYKKNAEAQRRMNYQNFVMTIKQVIVKIAEFQLQESAKHLKSQHQTTQYQQKRKAKIQQIYNLLCLKEKKKHLQKLRQMGVMCSQQVYVIPKINFISQRQSKQNSPIQQREKHHNSFHMPNLTKIKSQQIKQKQKKCSLGQLKNRTKIYKNSIQRRQSRLLHSLDINNLSQISPSDDVKNVLSKYVQSHDKFLKQYFTKQQKINKRLLAKLQSNQRNKQKQKLKYK